MEVNSSTIIVKDPVLYSQCKIVGRGDEGTVFNYQNKFAIKIFTRYKTAENRSKLERKLAKVQEMTSLRDPGVAFPLGLVSSNGKEVDGYYTRLIQGIDGLKDFTELKKLKDLRKAIVLLQKGDQTLKKIHDKGIALGDIKGNNILIDDSENPVFIDIDNAKYKHHMFDLIPDRAGCLYQMFHGPMSFQDNDKLLYALMALYIITKDKRFDFHSRKEDIQEALRNLHSDRQTQEILYDIFSDSINKPYVGEVLPRIR